MQTFMIFFIVDVVGLEPEATALERLPWERGLAMKYAADYEAFVERAAKHARPQSQADLEAMLDSMSAPPGDVPCVVTLTV